MFKPMYPGGKIWFLASPSRGFGVELARQLLATGHYVAVADGDGMKALAALPEAGDRLLLLGVDTTQAVQVDAAVEAIVRQFGRIDVLVNNVATAALGAVEEFSDADIGRAVDANLLNLWSVTRAVLPVMRAQRAGRIINLSTVAGISHGPGWGLFAAIASAVDAMSQTLADEVSSLGIDVMVAEPVPFRADLPAASLIVAKDQISDYYDTAARARRRYGFLPAQSVSDPVTGVTAVITAALADLPPRRLVLGHEGYYRALKRLEDQRDEQLAWREVSLAMDRVL